MKQSTPTEKQDKNEPNVNFGMYEKNRVAKRQAQSVNGLTQPISNHTPGEWGTGDYIDPETRKRHLAVWEPNVVLGEVGHPICLVAPKEKETERDRANARLIASAPALLRSNGELLEAIKGLLICIGSYAGSGHYPPSDEPEIVKARAAIRNAEAVKESK